MSDIYDHYTVVGPNGEPSGHIPKVGHESADPSLARKLQKILRHRMKHKTPAVKRGPRKMKHSNYY